VYNALISMKVSPDYNLAKIYPHLTEEWDFEKNAGKKPTEFTPNSGQKVDWICSKDKNHKWKAKIADRTRKNGIPRGCPYCSGHRPSEDNNLLFKFPKLCKEWDYGKNENLNTKNIPPNSHKKIWWKCKQNHSWEATIINRTRHNSGCPYCSGRRPSEDNNLAKTHPLLVVEWDYEKNGELKPEMLAPVAGKKVHWICSKDKNHKWKARVAHRTSKIPTGCPYCCLRYSKPHQEINNFISTFYSGKLKTNDRKTIKNPLTNWSLELDTFLPELKKAIEFNGRFYHKNDDVKQRDEIKKQECEKNGIGLLIIEENDWKKDKELEKNKIKSFILENKK